MRRQFDKQIMTKAGLVAERSRTSRMVQAREITPPIKKKRSKGQSFRTLISKVASLLGIKRRLEPWELKAKAAAEAKRARRRERNLRWWAADATWEGNRE